MSDITYLGTRIYSIQLSETVEISIHVARFNTRGKRTTMCSLCGYVKPFSGHMPVNTSIENRRAISQLLDWRKMGFPIHKFTMMPFREETNETQ